MKNERILVWDLPVRLFHWLLVASFAGTWLTAESERWREVHVLLGYTMFGLIAFRLLWGFVGSRYARFTSFVAGPATVARYLASLTQPAPERHIGHNPAGGWSIFALIGLALATIATGYFTYESIGARIMEKLHEGAATAMLIIVGVHVAGVVASSVLHRENLLRAMITGIKHGMASEGIGKPRRITAMVLLVAVAAFWTLALRGDLPVVYEAGPAAEQRQTGARG